MEDECVSNGSRTGPTIQSVDGSRIVHRLRYGSGRRAEIHASALADAEGNPSHLRLFRRSLFPNHGSVRLYESTCYDSKNDGVY